VVVERSNNEPGDDIAAFLVARHPAADLYKLTSVADHKAYLTWVSAMMPGDPEAEPPTLPALVGNTAEVDLDDLLVRLKNPANVEQDTLTLVAV
jgi:hypothetical protein